MKKSLSVAAILTICVVFVVSCAAEKKAMPYRAGFVNYVAGEVFIVNADGGKVVPQSGTPVKSGMKIVSFGKKSLCEIYFGENAVKVFGDSELEIDSLLINKETMAQNTSFRLWKGRVFVRIAGKLFKGDEFSVKTLTSVAAVRGTQFFVSQDKRKSNVACVEGKVEVSNPKIKKTKPVLLEENQDATVAKGKEPKKATIKKDRKKILDKDSEVKPATEENKSTMARLEDGDAKTVESLMKKFEEMKKKGDAASKNTSVDKNETGKKKVDLIFFKSKD